MFIWGDTTTCIENETFIENETLYILNLCKTTLDKTVKCHLHFQKQTNFKLHQAC